MTWLFIYWVIQCYVDGVSWWLSRMVFRISTLMFIGVYGMKLSWMMMPLMFCHTRVIIIWFSHDYGYLSLFVVSHVLYWKYLYKFIVMMIVSLVLSEIGDYKYKFLDDDDCLSCIVRECLFKLFVSLMFRR